jgi:hypothetical protein
MWVGVWLFLLILAVLVTEIVSRLMTNSTAFIDVVDWYQKYAPGGFGQAVKKILSPWLRWDTMWYLWIAREGYTVKENAVAFAPMYPFLIRIFGSLFGGQYLLVAMVISWGSFFGASSLLLDWANSVEAEVPSSGVLWAMLTFPSAFFFFAGYTESLFLLLLLAAWQFARQGRWPLVGLLGAAATLTRFSGVFLILPFLMIFWEQYRAGKGGWVKVLWLGLIPAVFLLWNIYAKFRYGLYPSAGLDLGWELHWGWPWETIVGNIQNIFTAPPHEAFPSILDLLTIFVVVWAAIWWFRRKAYPEVIYLVSILFLSITKVTDLGGAGSTSRYLLLLFPMYLTLASVRKHPVWGRVVSYLSVLLWVLASASFFLWLWVA